MFYIKGLENNIIDLDGFDEYSEEFEVVSLNDNDKRQPCGIEYISNEGIEVTFFGVNFVRISIDVSEIINDEYIILKNYIDETITLTVKPNQYYVDDKDYKFKITKSEFKDNNDLRLKILSKVNGKELGWKCTYDGKPISYSITPMENDKSCFINVKLLSQLFVDYTSVLIFEQDESGETIEYNILNTPEGMKKAD